MRITLCVASCVAGALWLFPGSVAGQEAPRLHRLALAQARELARRSSPEIAAARHALAAAAGRERQAGAWPNPTIAYSREQTSRDGESSAQDIVSLEQPLEVGGQRGARRAAAGFARSAAEARVASAAAEVDLEVARTYAAAVAAGRRAILAEEAAGAFARAVRTSEARLASGDVSGYQNRRLALEAARYSAFRLEALVARDSALRTLISLTGLADSAGTAAPFELTDTLIPAPLTLSADSLAGLALSHRPELRARRLEANAGAADARLAAAERIPTPLVSAGYKHERPAGAGSLGGFVAGISLPLALWDRRGGAVSAARAEAARRSTEVEALERQTAREVGVAFTAHQALADQLALLSAQLGSSAATALQAAEVAHREGEIGLLEWLDSVRAYQEAEASYATLWAEYIARRAALERATGATLF
ncbi:MAG: TolC family protein [Gemmatimonadales bacterium]|nr:TolC family protein [Gemmatimonadales bacterium]